MSLYHRIASLIPSPIIKGFKKQLDYVGWETPEMRLVGFIFSFGLAISIGIALNLYVFLNLPVYITFPLLFVLFAGGIYIWLNIMAENRAKFVEKILPDVLQLVASNMKAGLTTERALLASARPEFGIFSKELKLASAKVISGERIEDALNDIAKKIKSPILERTTWLMIQGIKSGGEVADLLSQLAGDLREENALKEETQAEVSMYIMLIFFGAAFGAPVLFSISSYIVGVLNEQTANIALDPEQFKEISQRSPVGRMFGIPEVKITEEFATMFSLLALLVTCVFSGMIMGTINTGKEIQGIKYIPIVTIIAFALFFIIRIVLVEVLGSINTMF